MTALAVVLGLAPAAFGEDVSWDFRVKVLEERVRTLEAKIAALTGTPAAPAVKVMPYAEALQRAVNGGYFVLAVRTTPRPNLFLIHTVYACDDAPRSVRSGHYLCESDGRGGAVWTDVTGRESAPPAREVRQAVPFAAGTSAFTGVTTVPGRGVPGLGTWLTGGIQAGRTGTGVRFVVPFGTTSGCAGGNCQIQR